MRPPPYLLVTLSVLVGMMAPALHANRVDDANESMRRFLAQEDRQPTYSAIRRLEAETGSRKGWLEATTTYTPATGFRYQITKEEGSGSVRDKLRAVLEGEREIVASGEAARSTLAPANYTFQSNGVDADGLANILLTPRRKDRVLVKGTMFLQPEGARLVRIKGRLAKSPSFWVKHVDVVRTFERLNGQVVPVLLESSAHIRMFGPATFRMTYRYTEINGRAVSNGATSSVN